MVASTALVVAALLSSEPKITSYTTEGGALVVRVAGQRVAVQPNRVRGAWIVESGRRIAFRVGPNGRGYEGNGEDLFVWSPVSRRSTLLLSDNLQLGGLREARSRKGEPAWVLVGTSPERDQWAMTYVLDPRAGVVWAAAGTRDPLVRRGKLSVRVGSPSQWHAIEEGDLTVGRLPRRTYDLDPLLLEPASSEPDVFWPTERD